jgi:hypothetical protein
VNTDIVSEAIGSAVGIRPPFAIQQNFSKMDKLKPQTLKLKRIARHCVNRLNPLLGDAMQAILALEDGRIFRGLGYGHPSECQGEVVFPMPDKS